MRGSQNSRRPDCKPVSAWGVALLILLAVPVSGLALEQPPTGTPPGAETVADPQEAKSDAQETKKTENAEEPPPV